MNGLQARYRTFGELLTELKARLSFVAQGPSSNNNNTVLSSFLQEGHDFIFSELDPTPARKRTTVTTEPGSVLYDWHNDIEDELIDPATVFGVHVTLSDQLRNPLSYGIDEAMRGYATRSYPQRYQTVNGQMEIWPTPDKAYDLIIEYTAPIPRFSQPQDRPGVPDRLILLYAIANAKAHYRQPDAQAAGTTFSKMLATKKSRRHEGRRYLAGSDGSEETVMRQADGSYTFQVRG